jgi:hypothetical protein
VVPETRNKSQSELETLFVGRTEKETLSERELDQEPRVEVGTVIKDGV